MTSTPVARVDTVTDALHGTTIEDPYRWMEDWRGEELRSWVEGQAQYARGWLDAIPERAELLSRINGLAAANPELSNLQIRAGRMFYLRRDPGERVAKLVVRMAIDAPETVLFDPNTLPDAVHTSIDWYCPAPDGRRVAYGSSPGGSEESVLRVLEVDSGKSMDVAITRTNFGGVAWLDGGQSFTYNRLRELPEGTPETERYLDSRTYLHQVGEDPEQDPAVFGRGVHVGVELAREDIPVVVSTPASDWVVGAVFHGVMNELTLYAARRAALSAPDAVSWIKVVAVEDAATAFDIKGDTLYLLTHRDAPRFRVVARSILEPGVSRTLLPQADRVNRDLMVSGEVLLTREIDGAIWRMRRVSLDAGDTNPTEEVPLPFGGTIGEWAGEPGSGEVVLRMESWTVSPRVYRYDVADGRLEDTGWLPPSPVDFSALESHEVHAPSKDGTLVPLSIVYRGGIALDGSNPTLLTG